MKIYDVIQGTSAWQDLRVGVATASNFERILTPAKLAFSSQAEGYALQLLAEEHLGMKLDKALGSASVSRGDVLEKKALGLYRLQHDDAELRRIGFVTRDDGKVGCSPDHFVDANGMLEIKCPEPVQHVEYLVDSKGIGYNLQVQGGLWLCEKDYCDTMSYHPDMPPALVRQGRDEKTIAAIAGAVDRFLEIKEDLKARLHKLGMFPGYLAEAPTLKVMSA